MIKKIRAGSAVADQPVWAAAGIILAWHIHGQGGARRDLTLSNGGVSLIRDSGDVSVGVLGDGERSLA